MSIKTEKSRDPYDGVRPGSAITHGVGIFLACMAAIFLLPRAYASPLLGALPAMAIYTGTLLALYTASTLYHSLRTNIRGRVALRKIDHLNIYYLIAGTYTPFCLLGLGGTLGIVLLTAIWSLAFIGTVVNLVWIHLPRWLTVAIYLIMGWIAIIVIYPLHQSIGGVGIFWLILGGVFYSVGGVLYAVKWPLRDHPKFGCHEIFHVFILLGSIAQFCAVLYTLPVGI
ncbi:MAG: hemolysin III family protein [Oscillospiraceae bacterium]|nr:hemolysin III family protein [Oscillospiraceae bacterium]